MLGAKTRKKSKRSLRNDEKSSELFFFRFKTRGWFFCFQIRSSNLLQVGFGKDLNMFIHRSPLNLRRRLSFVNSIGPAAAHFIVLLPYLFFCYITI